MIALQIQDVKSFMSKLLLQDTFDSFLLKEAEITMAVTHTIDGTLHPDFFDEPDFSDPLVRWGDIRQHCFSIIKGKRTPLHFTFVFRLGSDNTARLLSQNGLSLLPEQVSGLYLNCRFDGTHLLCTSGTALTFFTMDKALEHVWDELLQKFFRQNEIPYTLA